MERQTSLDTELATEFKKALLQEITKALVTCQSSNPTYPGQTQPLSDHLARLLAAVNSDDFETIKEYGRGKGSWFPYHNVVDVYLEVLEA